jgi:hypothetical protein
MKSCEVGFLYHPFELILLLLQAAAEGIPSFQENLKQN